MQGKESLWLQWVNHIYIKGSDFWGYSAPSNSSLQWKKIMELKDEVNQNLFSVINATTYTIGRGYRALIGEKQTMQWHRQVWNNWSVPKHCFIFWLAMLNRLQTRERIMKIMPVLDPKCVLCSEDKVESQSHLFFECSWSDGCLESLKKWLQWRCSGKDLKQLVRWIQRSKLSKFRKKVIEVSLAAGVYAIWQARNRQLWKNERMHTDVVLQHICYTVRTRIIHAKCTKIAKIDREWFDKL